MLIATIVGGLLIAPLLRDQPFLGFDWVVSFSQHIFDMDYPPWVCLMLRPLTALPSRTGLIILQGLAFSSVSLLTYRIARQTFPDNRLPAVIGVILVLISPYPWLVFWAGQIEVMVIIGIMAMPFGIPLLFAKPNLGIWIVFRSRRDIFLTLGFVLISFVIWGLWPLDQYSVDRNQAGKGTEIESENPRRCLMISHNQSRQRASGSRRCRTCRGPRLGTNKKCHLT